MAQENKPTTPNDAESIFAEQFASLDKESLAMAIRDFTEEAIIENNVYYDIDDIEAAVNRMYPIIAGVILSPNYSAARRDFHLFYEIITFLVKRFA